MADTAAALVIQLSADIKQFRSEMRNATGVFDKEGREIERRQARLRKNLEKGFGKGFGKVTGLSSLKTALMGLTAVGIVGGMAALVDKSLDAASAIGETAIKAGVSTKRLQELRFEASQTGSSFDKMDAALIFFNKSFGELLNTGKGKLAPSFKQFGLDKLVNNGQIRTAEQAFDAYIAKVQGVGSASQRSAYLAAAFGRNAGPEMAEFVDQGAAGLERLRQEANSLGIVLDEQTIDGAKEAKDKLSALFDVMKAQGTSAIATLAPQITELTQQIMDGLPGLILWVEKWADWFGIISMSNTQKLRAEISGLQSDIEALSAKKGKQNWLQRWDALGLFSISDRDLDVLISDAKARLSDAQSKLSGNVERPVGGKPFKLTAQGMHDFAYGKPKVHIPNSNAGAEARAAEAEERRAEAMAQRVQEVIANTGADAKTAEAAATAALSQANVERLRDTVAYYAAVKQQVADDLKTKIDGFEAERAEHVRSLSKIDMTQQQHMAAWNNIQREFEAKKKGAQSEADASLYQNMGGAELDDQLNRLRDQAATLGMTSEAAERYLLVQRALAAATALEAQGNEDAADAIRAKAAAYENASVEAEKNNESTQKQKQISDDFRDTLGEIVVNFDNAKSALASFLQMLAKMAAMEGIEAMFGKRGTQVSVGGGGSSGSSGLYGELLSSVWGGIKSIAGYANGTPPGGAPGGIAAVGERGIEYLNLPEGTTVTPAENVPRAPALSPLRGSAGSSGAVSVDNRRTVIVQGNADSAAVRQIQAHDRYLDSQLDSRIEMVLTRLKSGRRSIFN